MIFSHKQKLFLDYLLERLQFPSGEFRQRYLQYLAKRSKEFVTLASKPIERDHKTGDIIYPKDNEFKAYVEQDNRLLPTRFSLIDLLMLECDIKAKRQYNQLNPSTTLISATDISHFTYCPVGWSIAKTYQLTKLMSTQIGTSLHEQHKLIHFVRLQQPDGLDLPAESDFRSRTSELNFDSGGKELFRDLADSVAVFVGTPNEGETNVMLVSLITSSSTKKRKDILLWRRSSK
jgi:hypothetical protein